MFDLNVDKEVEWDGLGTSRPAIDPKNAAVIDEIADIEGDDVSSDELRSINNSSDEDGRSRCKYPIFNEETDMNNPIFALGMEFKTHSLFREAVKEYSIKWGKQITFDKHKYYKQKIKAVCKEGCP